MYAAIPNIAAEPTRHDAQSLKMIIEMKYVPTNLHDKQSSASSLRTLESFSGFSRSTRAGLIFFFGRPTSEEAMTMNRIVLRDQVLRTMFI